MKDVVRMEIKEHPKIATLKGILIFTLVISIIGSIVQQNWGLMILAIVITILIFLPIFIEKWTYIIIPDKLKVYIIIFIYASLFLGELKNYYAAYWWWDVTLHTSAGLAFGIVGFVILYILYKTGNIKTNPKTIAIFSFAFALSIGALWEIVEFTIDSTLGPISNGVPMQTVVNGCGLVDTMKDLINDSIGALLAAVLGYLYLKRDSSIVIEPMVKEFKKNNPRFFKTKKK